MSALTLYAGRPGSAYDAEWWRAVHELFEEAFPGLPAGIALARVVGAAWETVSTPFALFEGDRCVAHVGVLSHPLVARGRRIDAAGIHAVCTVRDRRRRGLSRRLLGEALTWADRKYAIAELSTDEPAVYVGHGFRMMPTFRFRSSLRPRDGVRSRLLQPSRFTEDRSLLADLLARRAPASDHLASVEPGSLVTIDAALGGRLDRCFWHLPDHDAIVAADRLRDDTLILDVIATRLPPADVVLSAVTDRSLPAFWAFRPDHFEPSARPEPSPPGSGAFMVRGAWPDGLSPFGISPLWEH